MPNCVVYGCTNRWDSTSKLKGITFHSFPLDQSRRAVWIHALRRKDWQPNKWSRICSVHFREEDIDRTSVSTVRIRENAIPSVFPGFPSHLQKKQIKRRSPKHREQTSKCTTATSIPQNEAATGIPQDDAALSVAHTETATSGPQDAAALMPANTVSPYVNETSEDTPVVKNLKRDVSVLLTKNEQYRKKLKVLQQSKRRLVKKVASLNSVIEELRRKHLVDEDSLGVLASIPGVHKELLQRQAAKANCQSVPRTYSPELRSFALTLNFYSPRAYKYVRKCFNTCLPHQRTLARWYQCVDGLPGFNSEAFAIIRANANHQTQGKQIVCSLLIDEIAIRQHIEFDGVKYYGYVDMGSSVEMDNLPIAKEAFVLMLVAINGSWKLPVGYFLTCGITGEQKAHLVKQCISLASASGIRVVSLSCDGCASNLSMAKCLGCNLNVDELKTTFAVQGDSFEVAFLLDPPHMLKLVRNALGDKKHFWDGEGHLISWYLFDVLHKLQVKEGLHIGNSITSSHINFVNNKMKVKLAAQLLSTSVADAMQYCSDIKVPGFEDAASTIKFIRVFNCLFDILNSRNLLQNKWKQPLNIHNFKVVERFLLEAQQYIKTLTVSQVCRGTRVVDSNRKTGFVGFLVCISSVLHLYANLVEPQSSVQLLKFIPVYKCSQDHLEMFFSALRSRGGWNNNPTARQFISAYKKLLIHNEIRESERGNCMALEDIPILTYNGQNIEQQINLTTERRQLIDRESHLISHDHDYVESEVILSEVATHIVVYIAGFVVRHLERTLQCELCLSVLRGQGSHTAYSLIHRKNRGGLISPSDDVIDICLCSEKVFRKYSAGKRKVPENYLHCKCVSDVLSTFLFKPVFKELSEHMKDQHPLDNHLILLIKAVAKRYLLTRQKHAAKCETDALHEKRMRTAYTKLILFKGQ